MRLGGSKCLLRSLCGSLAGWERICSQEYGPGDVFPLVITELFGDLASSWARFILVPIYSAELNLESA